jgi:hypothetical protein
MAVLRSPGHVVYTGEDRREVQVLVEGRWLPGELRSWDHDDNDTWSGMVTWSAGPAEQRLGRFFADRIARRDTAPSTARR